MFAKDAATMEPEIRKVHVVGCAAMRIDLGGEVQLPSASGHAGKDVRLRMESPMLELVQYVALCVPATSPPASHPFMCLIVAGDLLWRPRVVARSRLGVFVGAEMAEKGDSATDKDILRKT